MARSAVIRHAVYLLISFQPFLRFYAACRRGMSRAAMKEFQPFLRFYIVKIPDSSARPVCWFVSTLLEILSGALGFEFEPCVYGVSTLLEILLICAP